MLMYIGLPNAKGQKKFWLKNWRWRMSAILKIWKIAISQKLF